MAVWVRVAVAFEDFPRIRDAIDEHVGREDGTYPATWVEAEVPVPWLRRIAARLHKRWRSGWRPAFPDFADRAFVDRLERKLDGVVRHLGRDMIVEYREGDDMLVVIDVAGATGKDEG